MAETRGAFVLSKVILNRLDDKWVTPEEVYLNDPIPDAGYFGGGVPGAPYYSTMDKVSYASDTTAAVPGAVLSAPRGYLSATGNSIAGYFGGGQAAPSSYSTIDKVSYGSDTTVRIPSANLTVARFGLAATGNSVSGYFAGGFDGTNLRSTMDKVTYSTDITSQVPSVSLNVFTRTTIAATGNSTAGYFGGGSNLPSFYSTVEKVTYSTDTIGTIPGAALSVPRGYLAATGSSTAGYFGGGLGVPTPGTNYYSTVDKVTYSNDTTSVTPGASLNTPRSDLAATGSSSSGYFGGGLNGSGVYSTMNKTTYSTDTTAALPVGGFLSAARQTLAASSLRANGLPSTPIANTVTGSNFVSKGSSFNSGYFGGGFTGYSTMDKTVYSTDTTTQVPGASLSLSPGRYYMGATSNTTAGYFGGGLSPAPATARSTMDKVTYSSDTTAAVPSAFLVTARYLHAATGNSTAGYSGAGFGPASPAAEIGTVEKLTYSTDTSSAVPSASLQSYAYISATGNSTTGYFAGGNSSTTPGNWPTYVFKLNYSTDTTSGALNSYLSTGRQGIGAAGNSVAGYFGGGIAVTNPYSATDKITYSTDTTSLIGTAALSSARRGIGATGNSTFGYFGGGDVPGTVSTMDKLDYSTEITSRISGASLSTPRNWISASSSTANALPQQDITATPQAIQGNTGYFGGGSAGIVYRSTMDKVTYSTDTTAQVPGAPLSVVRDYLAATGSSTAGYFGGGNDSGNVYSTMDKVTYSSDTTVAVPGAFLSATAARSRLAATGNSSAGYFGGGIGAPPGSQRSTMDKVTYSTDTTAAVPGAFLSAARYKLAATGNSSFGYFGGGDPGNVSTMNKVTYSSDTPAVVPGAALSAGRVYLSATGNSTAGYFGGGFTTGTSSIMDRITYSTDTRSAVPNANLTTNRQNTGATGNSTTGYFGGGQSPTTSSTDKLTYTTETTVATPSANLSVARSALAASSSTANAVRGTVPQVPIV